MYPPEIVEKSTTKAAYLTVDISSGFSVASSRTQKCDANPSIPLRLPPLKLAKLAFFPRFLVEIHHHHWRYHSIKHLRRLHKDSTHPSQIWSKSICLDEVQTGLYVEVTMLLDS